MKYTEADYLNFDPCAGEEGEIACRTVKLRTARKAHACFMGAGSYGDGHQIQPGEKYRDERALVDSDYWGHYRVCIGCIDKWIDEIHGEAV